MIRSTGPATGVTRWAVFLPRKTLSVPASAMIRKEIRRFLDHLFDGSAGPLVAHLAEMNQVSLNDLAEIETRLRVANKAGAARKPIKPRRKRNE